MKKILLTIIAGALAVTANAATIAYWDFNSGSSATSGTYSASVLDVAVGTGTLQYSGSEQTVFGGTVTNLLDGDATGRGVALAIVGGAGNINNGSYLTFTLNMTNYDDLIMSFAAQRTATGFNSAVVSYSIDGGASFTDFVTLATFQSSMGTTTAVPAAISTVDFSSLNFTGIANLQVRMTLSGATASSGNNRFDNVQFNATAIPEPSTYAMLFAGAGLVCWAVRRKRA